jgi:hypothetical protein
MPKIKRTYAASGVCFPPASQSASPEPRKAAPHRRCTDYDVDKLVFWVCVLLFAIAFAGVK